jgi:5-hydroxyisourate hydrolase
LNDSSTPRRRFLASGVATGGLLAAGLARGQVPAAPTGLAVAPTSQLGVSPRLTFHGIDTHRGGTAAGLTLDLSRFEQGAYRKLGSFASVLGGRVADPLLIGDTYIAGRYEILVHIAAYYERVGIALPKPAFLTSIPLRFAIHDARERVHLPVLFTPWSYSYYRGS